MGGWVQKQDERKKKEDRSSNHTTRDTHVSTLSSNHPTPPPTPTQVYALCEEDVLDENRLCEIMACGFSRIPVHSPRSRCDIRGFLLVKCVDRVGWMDMHAVID